MRNRNFFAEYSESPKKFIYMPDQLDNPEVQDLDLDAEERSSNNTTTSVGGDTGASETTDVYHRAQQQQEEKPSAVKIKEFTEEEIEQDRVRENELMAECLEAAKDSVIKCNLCTYAVDNKDSFREHLRRRHLDKRHICEMCGAAFGMHNDLLKHKRRSHIHRHHCGICGKVYR